MNNLDSLVSIIMPAYNARHTIEAAINSVIDQTYPNWELLVLDDGSTDETSSIVKKFNDTRILLIQKENTGVADTRNIGLKKTSGDFIAFLDSDDLWMHDKLEKQLSIFKSKDVNVGLIHTNYVEFTSKKEFKPKPFKYTKRKKLEGDVYEAIMIHDFVATLTVMVRKEVLNKIGLFDTKLNGTEDWDLWIRIAKEYTFYFIDLPLAKYRLSPKGLSKSVSIFEKELWKVINKHLMTSNLSKIKKTKGIWLYSRHMAHSYARNKDFKKAHDFLLKAIKARPGNIRNVVSASYIFALKVFHLIARLIPRKKFLL